MRDWARIEATRRTRALACAALVLALGCGGDENEVVVELTRGEQRSVELTVTASQIFGGRLLECDFVSLRPKDPDNQLALQNMEIAVSDSGKSSDVACTARIEIFVHPDAILGDYGIDVDFTYTYTDQNDILTGEDQGRVKVSVVR
ncbi:MAG: hypothetical protein IPK07_08435 [Deltaproteobacteria bacterium]|nr:hypothetical protein [Deltaproteobacteria bacterium]